MKFLKRCLATIALASAVYSCYGTKVPVSSEYKKLSPYNPSLIEERRQRDLKRRIEDNLIEVCFERDIPKSKEGVVPVRHKNYFSREVLTANDFSRFLFERRRRLRSFVEAGFLENSFFSYRHRELEGEERPFLAAKIFCKYLWKNVILNKDNESFSGVREINDSAREVLKSPFMIFLPTWKTNLDFNIGSNSYSVKVSKSRGPTELGLRHSMGGSDKLTQLFVAVNF